MPRVITFGCRLNTFESALIEKIAGDDDNTIVVNTCCVTKEAERQARQAIRALRKKNPDARIIVTGCAAQVNAKTYASMPEVDQVLGNDDKLKPESYKQEDRVLVSDIMQVKSIAPHLVDSFCDKVRAFIQIQNGCNNRCTFCTIPYARGHSRSVALGQIAEQIRVLMNQGIQEFTLTGVNITQYGLDLPGTPTLGQTIKRLLDLVPDLTRLRLSSLDLDEMDDDVWDVILHDVRILPHVHLSLQSGDDVILKRMKRRHTMQQAYDAITRLRESSKQITIGTDLIVGFPTESEQAFSNSLDLARHIDFIHSFPYSAHEKTASALMQQVPKNIIKQRAKDMTAVKQEQLTKLFERFNGQTARLLIEKIENGVAFGKTDHFISVTCPALSKSRVGDIIDAHINGHDRKKLSAQINYD